MLGTYLLLGFSRVLFRSNRTRVVRHVRRPRSKASQPAPPQPQLNWRTLVGTPLGDGPTGRR